MSLTRQIWVPGLASAFLFFLLAYNINPIPPIPIMMIVIRVGMRRLQ
jgi:hypothetical protein